MQTSNLPSTLIFVRRSIKPPEDAGAGFDPRPAITGSSGAPTPQTMGRWAARPINPASVPPRLGMWRQCRRRRPVSQAKKPPADQTADDRGNSLTHLKESALAPLARRPDVAASGTGRRPFGRQWHRVRRSRPRGRGLRVGPGARGVSKRRRASAEPGRRRKRLTDGPHMPSWVSRPAPYSSRR